MKTKINDLEFIQISHWVMLYLTSIAKGPKFQPQSSKRAEKNLVGPGKSGAELLPDLSKKGQTFFRSGLS
jgi:hypothetical protein